MRRLLRPFPWAQLGLLCLGIVLAPLQAIALALTGLAVPLAVLSPRPFLFLAEGLAALCALDRTRFLVLHGRAVGQPLPGAPRDLDGRDQMAWLLAHPAHQRVASYTIVRLGLAAIQTLALTVTLTFPLVVLASAAAGFSLGYEPRGVFLGFFDPVLALLLVAVTVTLLLFGVPALVRGLAWVDHRITTTLLGSAETDELERRVGELVSARERTVSAADDERSRLERDLHDGAQQRLIALSVLLGQVEGRLAAGDPAPGDGGALALVRRARDEASGTIDELRTLTRGLRPPILEARGLDAALSAVAARLPMPVDIRIDLPRRPDPAREAMLYFAVTELLTNVAKHAQGAPASVEVYGDGALIRAIVADAGPGGADVARGTGLRGIATRLAGVDGRLFLSSPVGGPTVITVEVPCA